jgi:hypothetical protein
MTNDFFGILLDLESNIDSAEVDAAASDDGLPDLDYWAVEAPGRLRRHPDSGDPIGERVSFSEFLARTGVAELRRTHGVKAAQYAIINPWGFVGYQFGEPLLIDLQYYRPAVETVTVEGAPRRLPSYYASSLPVSTWRAGQTSHVFDDEFSGLLRVGTDVNTWQGTFTGKDGITSLDDLRTEKGQQAVLRCSLQRNATILENHLSRDGRSMWSGDPQLPPPAALLAGCHLSGAYSDIDHLVTSASHHDETGTSLTSYLGRFAGCRLEREQIF